MSHTPAVFHFNDEKCTACGLCRRFCPSKRIYPTKKEPLCEEIYEHCQLKMLL
ncbi:4Fe-4S binding protein [Acetobacterium wieringae]|uniref:4Fe-4S binding protein n=1 Tax=Acetobacterium wieringae TaxID=52694 RepID=UPI00350E391F